MDGVDGCCDKKMTSVGNSQVETREVVFRGTSWKKSNVNKETCAVDSGMWDGRVVVKARVGLSSLRRPNGESVPR